MSDGPLPELIKKMIPLLADLAKLIGDGINPDQDILKKILSKASADKDEKALDEFKRWCEILRKVNSISDDSEQKQETIVALQERGIPEAPATLAVWLAAGKTLTSEPDAIDFGLLKPGEGANTTLKVSGKLSNVKKHYGRLNVSLLKITSTDTLVKIVLLGGQAGESFKDDVVLQGETGEIKVPVTARWAGRTEICPICKAVGAHGEGSLFWNSHKNKFECFNHDCKVEGPSLDKLRKPPAHYNPGLFKFK